MKIPEDGIVRCEKFESKQCRLFVVKTLRFRAQCTCCDLEDETKKPCEKCHDVPTPCHKWENKPLPAGWANWAV